MEVGQRKIGVMILIDHLGTGGAETHVLQLLRWLDHKRYDLTLVCLREPGYRYDTVDRSEIDKIVCNLDSILKPVRLLKTIWRLVRLVRRKKVSIIHTYIFNPTVVGTLVKLCNPKTRLITTRRDTGFWHTEKHWIVYRAINRWADKIACVCQAVEKVTEEKEGVKPDKLITIYNGIDLSRYEIDQSLIVAGRREYAIDEKDVVIGMVAIFRPEKRHDLFIQAAAQLCNSSTDQSDKDSSIKFMLIGGGDPEAEESIRALVDQYGLQDRFVFTGLLTDVKPALARLDIMVLCSDYEAMSNAIIEAMAMSKPVIATQVGGNVELVEEGVTGLLFPRGDVKALVKQLEKVIYDNELKADMGRRAREKVESEFDIDVMVKNTESLYQAVTGELNR